MAARDLLIEIGTEELPPKALLFLSQAFEQELRSRLVNAGLAFSDIEPYATPRRLALKIIALAETQGDVLVERFGPAVQAAFDRDGNPSKAAEGFARSCGVKVDQLEQKNDGKVDKLFFSSARPGDPTSKIIPDLLNEALSALPIPRRMRWGSSREEFVRPVHWVLLLFGEQLLPATIMGLEAGTISFGHRFMHPHPVPLKSTDEYPDLLRKAAFVEASFRQRKELIRTQVNQEAQAKNACTVIDEELLDEVTALVEWPVALTGNFDPAYLQVPREALISSLKSHQKCFYLTDENQTLLPHFITVSNLVSKDPSAVIKGNEKVIGPRLADAAFFYEQDKKAPFASHAETLKRVIFQQDLGSVFDKSLRVKQLALFLSEQLGVDPVLPGRAAELAKCDLLTNMVGEFADLQGIMGHYYALNDGEPAEVALAIEEQYLPRFAGDALPTSDSGTILALAERLDTIVGLFGIGQPPSGSRDPFALRRAALGILRIILENNLRLDLALCTAHAASLFHDLAESEGLTQRVLDFIYERLRAYYADQGIDTRIFQAVDAVRPAQPVLFDQQLKAVSHFSTLPEADALAAANKRVANILAKLERFPGAVINRDLLTENAEVVLADRLAVINAQSIPLLKTGNFQEALSVMASLQEPLDNFFDSVMVNADDEALKQNRQALLAQIRKLFLQVADISYLQ